MFIFMTFPCIFLINAALLEVRLHFPITKLNDAYYEATSDNTLFGINYVTCFDAQDYSQNSCPGGEGVFTTLLRITPNNFVGNDTWSISLPVNDWIGNGYVDIYTPQVYAPNGDSYYQSPVTACTQKEIYEMGGEMCQQQGSAWTVFIDTSDIVLDVYPAFGVEEGTTYTILPDLYSPQLNNSRNVSAYVPSSITQNTVKRPVGVLILLDGSQAIVDTFSRRGGFEAGQAEGSVPESIMIGITALEFALAGDFDERTYEMTYAESLDDSQSCPQGNGPTGGSDKLLDWIDSEVIPQALESLGMECGEVSIAGGSLGGLTSCYAASKYPHVFARALCMSLTNCFNFGVGGLAPVIETNFETSKLAPKSVIQLMGAEGLVEVFGDSNETQYDFMVKDELAWRSIGLEPMSWNVDKVEQMWSGAPFGYWSEIPAPENAIMTFILPGGQHAQTTWEREFAMSLAPLYRPSPSNPTRLPLSETIRYISPTLASN